MASSLAFAWSLGSSPLTRGKRGPVRGDAGKDGLIPAHAGKTSEVWREQPWMTAHPRSRGENRGLIRRVRGQAGSSPLTRGKRPCSTRERLPHRLIPAHAGKTKAPPPESITTAAHPRSRGENWRRRARLIASRGSSPLTRGKLGPNSVPCGLNRLIPAHAGKTTSTSSPV